MCFTLYMASDNECPMSSWDKDAPAFYVERQEGTGALFYGGLDTKFSTKYWYYLGSSEGCGCGFSQADDIKYPDFTEREGIRKNQQDLFSYISKCLENETFIELYGCWAGSETRKSYTRREIKVQEIVNEDFFFAEDELITVRKLRR